MVIEPFKGTLAQKLTTYFFCPIRKLIFFKDIFLYTLSDESKFFEVKFIQHQTSFSATRMQIVRHVTNKGAEEGA